MGRLRLVNGRLLLRALAPAAFVVGVTIAVLLVRSGLHDSGGSTGTRTGTVRPVTTTAPRAVKHYYRIRSGDTYELVALRFDTTVAKLLALNPGVEPTALAPGQKIRIR